MHEHSPVTRENAARSNQIEASQRQNAPVTRENAAPGMRANAAPTTRDANAAQMMRGNGGMRDGSAASGRIEPSRNGFAPSTSWNRFNEARGEARGEARPAEFPGGSERGTPATDTRNGGVSAPRGGGREGQAPSDSWGRFNEARGEAYESRHNPYNEREASPSYAHEMPSYSRGSNGSPDSRGSYPSYSRGSYGSPYSRGSYPSSPRGSYGPPPSYSRGNVAPSRPSGGGGGGGGGERHGGGGRPPQ